MITISLLSDIKFFAKKYLKNPVLVAALGYIVYKYISNHIKKEGMAESIKVFKDDNNYSIIYDDKTQKYILIFGTNVYSADSKEELELFAKKLQGDKK